MRQLSIMQAAGLELARDVPTNLPGGLPMLREGVVLSAAYVRALREAGISRVWVHDELSDGIVVEEPLDPSVRVEAQRATATALDSARRALEVGQGLRGPQVKQMRSVIELVLSGLAESPHALTTLSDLATADAYTHRHSIGVTVVGLLVGREHLTREGWVDWQRQRRFDRIDERLVQLGLGLLLMDVGKAALPESLLTKPGELTHAEWRAVRQHPEIGVRLLRQADLSPTALAIVRSHHERADGLGYPDALPPERTHLFPKIAAVADAYDAITSARPDAPAREDWQGVKIIRDSAGSQFDPAVVETFLRVVRPFPVGTTLKLADGREAVVFAVDERDPGLVSVRTRDAAGQIVEAQARPSLD